MVTLNIDNKQVTVPEGTTILQAAKEANINIPHLCYFEGLKSYSGCRVCVVEIEGEPRLATSCSRKVAEGMKVNTHSARVRRARRTILEILLANHPQDCFNCERNQNCDLLRLAFECGVKKLRFEESEKRVLPIDNTSPSIIRDPNKCIACGRCVRVCHDIQTVNAIGFINKGPDTMVATSMDRGMGNVACANCGQCILVCPVGAIKERSAVDAVWAAIADPAKHVVVQEAPSIRVSLGEELGLPAGTLVAKKMYAALRRLGFDAVFDTNFTADLTILEEGSELVERVKEGGVLPQLTSCCPGWVKFMEHYYPELAPNVSSAKSPQQMFGAVCKTYYAEKAGIDPKTIVNVSVMPCTAKKFECQRPEMNDSGFKDVDYVLTTRELARMIKEAGLDFVSLDEEPAEDLLGLYTGAATIFGATGGVMEAAIRSAYMLITGRELENLDIEPVRGLEGVKTATLNVDGLELKVAVAHGLGNARALLEEIKEGTSPYHFIEIMACPGGCVGGGGQPIRFDSSLKKKRGEALYEEDRHMPKRCSHHNPSIAKIYADYLEKPLGKRSHKLLHTEYTSRPVV
ncbi:MAG: ferredoxin [Dehalococcoides mccartyi]|uniref:NADH-dependent [FeFe] hydrogenase, group A6 n=1 Tax=Dehalococcoides mccartyi TaxID=61435 RepID=UPI000805BAFE|nr:NADH-dependent [FeFe] hydrogenase, group A6 [Dehalococcoides mccartyi]OBW62854.1 MAG: ferredoxin [Dehalococcoides mccartyi]